MHFSVEARLISINKLLIIFLVTGIKTIGYAKSFLLKSFIFFMKLAELHLRKYFKTSSAKQNLFSIYEACTA